MLLFDAVLKTCFKKPSLLQFCWGDCGEVGLRTLPSSKVCNGVKSLKNTVLCSTLDKRPIPYILNSERVDTTPIIINHLR